MRVVGVKGVCFWEAFAIFNCGRYVEIEGAFRRALDDAASVTRESPDLRDCNYSAPDSLTLSIDSAGLTDWQRRQIAAG